MKLATGCYMKIDLMLINFILMLKKQLVTQMVPSLLLVVCGLMPESLFHLIKINSTFTNQAS
jgi:hypothetical protein